MEIKKISFKNPEQKIIKKAAKVIKSGGILVYPTDTCYGLGVDPYNKKAVRDLRELKQREKRKPISVVVNFKMLKKICQVEKKQEKILKKYLPGPFTFILNLNLRNLEGRGLKFIAKGNKIGIRIPDCKLTSALFNELNIPYTTTSANISGRKSLYNIKDILKQFKNKQPDLILDAGKLPKNLPSTVVDLTKKEPKILRKGRDKITEKEN